MLKHELEKTDKKLDELKQEFDDLKEVSNPKIIYKKCHSCGSDLIPPLNIVGIVTANRQVTDFIVCPICTRGI